MKLAINQIWQENDPRHPREVCVLMIEPSKAPKDVLIFCAASTRSAWVRSSRFNGKRGGYKFLRSESAADGSNSPEGK